MIEEKRSNRRLPVFSSPSLILEGAGEEAPRGLLFLHRRKVRPDVLQAGKQGELPHTFPWNYSGTKSCVSAHHAEIVTGTKEQKNRRRSEILFMMRTCY